MSDATTGGVAAAEQTRAESGRAKSGRAAGRHERLDGHVRLVLPWARLWHGYSLPIVLTAVFAVLFLGHTVFGWYQYAADQQTSGQAATVFGPDGYIVYWGEWTLQNWQSEVLGALLIVMLSMWFVARGSAESRDAEDRMERSLTRIEERLDTLEALTRDAVEQGRHGPTGPEAVSAASDRHAEER